MKTRSIAQRESQQQIRDRGGYTRDIYHGKPLINRDEKKEKFQNKMAYGVEDPVIEYRKMKQNEKPKPEPIDR